MPQGAWLFVVFYLKKKKMKMKIHAPAKIHATPTVPENLWFSMPTLCHTIEDTLGLTITIVYGIIEWKRCSYRIRRDPCKGSAVVAGNGKLPASGDIESCNSARLIRTQAGNPTDKYRRNDNGVFSPNPERRRMLIGIQSRRKDLIGIKNKCLAELGVIS